MSENHLSAIFARKSHAVLPAWFSVCCIISSGSHSLVENSLCRFGVRLGLSLRESRRCSYSVREPADGEWGIARGDGTWSGIVGMVLNKVGDPVFASDVPAGKPSNQFCFRHAFQFNEHPRLLLRLPWSSETWASTLG